jgi:hypothetical protein
MLLPFIVRPFHIDDPMFVLVGQQIVRHPADFHGFIVNWEGYDRPAGRIFPIPPLTSYYFAAVSLIAGWREIPLHLAMLPFSILSVAGTYLLAARFCTRPALAAAALLLSPAFLISSTTLMCDPMLLCFWIWAVLCWVWGREKSILFLAISAGLISTAVLTKFTALGLIPLLAFHSIVVPASRRRWAVQFAALFFPVLFAIGYDHLYAHLYGFGAFENAAEYSTRSQAALNIPAGLRILNTLVFVGGSGATACLIVLLLRWRYFTVVIFAITVAAIAAIAAKSTTAPEGWLDTSAHPRHASLTPRTLAFWFQFSAMLGLAGVFLIQSCRSFSDAVRNRNWQYDAFLIIWICGLFVFGAFLNLSINVRSILPMMPALCILATRLLDRVGKLSMIRIGLVLFLGAAISIAAVVGDYHLASTVKTASRSIAREIRSASAASPSAASPAMWFAGHWGFQYYMQLAGARSLDYAAPKFHAGDYVVFPESGYGGTPSAHGFLFVREEIFGSDHWSATASPRMGAGFYHSDGYALPFVFGPIAAEKFVVVQVTDESRLEP